jgi:DNA-binding MarR family transcriptional regulator
MWELIDALRVFAVESDMFVDVFARAHGLGRSDLNAIMWLSQGAEAGQPLTAGDLAAKIGLGAPATTTLIDRLEASGHVRRSRDQRDRRRVIVLVEPAAMEMAAAFFGPLGARMGETMAERSVQELAFVASVLRELTVAVVDERAATTLEKPTGRGSAAA